MVARTSAFINIVVLVVSLAVIDFVVGRATSLRNKREALVLQGLLSFLLSDKGAGGLLPSEKFLLGKHLRDLLGEDAPTTATLRYRWTRAENLTYDIVRVVNECMETYIRVALLYEGLKNTHSELSSPSLFEYRASIRLEIGPILVPEILKIAHNLRSIFACKEGDSSLPLLKAGEPYF